mgnify:CR=1 FL=1
MCFDNPGRVGPAREDVDAKSFTEDAQQLCRLNALIEEVGADRAMFLKYLGTDDLAELPAKFFDKAVKALEAKRDK